MMPSPTSHTYISQRLRLHYLDWGNPDAPPLVLVHGGRDHARSWDWVVERLRDRWHIIAPDLRGHGDSPVVARRRLRHAGSYLRSRATCSSAPACARDPDWPFARRQHRDPLRWHLSRQGEAPRLDRGPRIIAQGDGRAPRQAFGRAHARLDRGAARPRRPAAATL